MAYLKEVLAQVAANLLRNKLRSFLTMAGIAWGVASMVLIVAKRGNLVNATIHINGLPFTVVGLMPEKNQNSSYNGLDTDKIYMPYSTMVRDVPPKDSAFVPGIVSDIIYVPMSLEQWKDAQRQ